MPVRTVDRSREAIRKLDRASYYAIDAATNQMQRTVTNAFGKHYTSGAFRDSLKVRANIRRSDPEKDVDGKWHARIGIKPNIRNAQEQNPRDDKKKVYGVGEIALAWELGHHNVFTRRYERVEIWVPKAQESVPAARTAFARVMKRYMEMSNA